MTPEEKERYHRQMMHPGFREKHQVRIRGASVLLAGIGGLGGAIAYGMAAAGVGRIALVHSGPLAEPDMNRQTLMSEAAIGESRVMTAAKRLNEFSRFVKVEPHDMPITEETFSPLMEDVDLIIDARHNFPERRCLNRMSVKRSVPLLFAAMDGLHAQMALFMPESTGCLDCLYPDDPPDWDPFGFAVFGAAAHAIGAMAAMEAVKYLSGYGSVSKNIVTMDMADCTTRSFKLKPIPGCHTCGAQRGISAVPGSGLLCSQSGIYPAG